MLPPPLPTSHQPRSRDFSKHSKTRWLSAAAIAAAALLQFGPLVAPTLGQETPAAPATAGAPDKKLVSLADDFLHYSIVGNVDLAKDTGQAILNANAEPRDLLVAFETAADERDVPAILTRDLRQPDLKDVATQLLAKIEEGHRTTVRDPQRIKTEIERLDDSPRAYMNAKERLISAGPFAVPFYVQYLQDTKHATLRPYVIRLMGEIGQTLLPPLVQQLQTPNTNERLTLVQVIGQIGYPQAVPYLKLLEADESNTTELKSAITAAIAACDSRSQWSKLSTADAFQALAQQYYSKDTAALPYPAEPNNPVWFYDKGLDNVTNVPVPSAIWSSVETMRATERALKTEPNKAASISLWLAANMRREILLPAGAKDPTHPQAAADASFYAVAAGPLYLNPVLTTALNQRDTALALRTIAALEATAGTQGLMNSKDTNPLVRSVSYPDRAVRFAAAFALARANPAKEYPGYFRVVPVLIEAISQTASPSVLLVDADQDNRNRIKGILVAMTPAYVVYDGPTLGAALESAHSAAAFDAVILPAAAEGQMREFANTDYRLAAAPAVLVATGPSQSGTIKPDADDKTITQAMADAKAVVGQTPIDQTAATGYTTTAIKLLSALAVDHASIYNVNEAVPALTEALKDKRPEIATAAAAVLGQLNNAEAQKALAAASLADGTDPALRAAFFSALAESAKHAGDTLDAASVDKVIKTLSTPDLDAAVRNAAATALGALNVPGNQASSLILHQVK